MKAYKILQKKLDLLNQELSEIVTHGITTERILDEIKEINEAISELEALQEPKTCDGCKYDSDHRFGCYRWDDCSREHTRKQRIDRYEPKV